MKDFAKSIVCNTKVGNIKDDAKAKELYKKMMEAKEIAEGWGRASNYQKKDNLEGGKKAADEAYKKAKREYESYAMNKKVGNADPRIASLKAKIQQNKDDIGALKDVHYMAKDMENDLRKRRDELEKELEEVRKDIEGWREVKDKAEVAWRVAESKKA